MVIERLKRRVGLSGRVTEPGKDGEADPHTDAEHQIKQKALGLLGTDCLEVTSGVSGTIYYLTSSRVEGDEFSVMLIRPFEGDEYDLCIWPNNEFYEAVKESGQEERTYFEARRTRGYRPGTVVQVSQFTSMFLRSTVTSEDIDFKEREFFNYPEDSDMSVRRIK